MPKYQLYYFNVRARGEPARMVLAQAGVDYEDIRFSFEEWPKWQNKSPNGKAPWLVIDGQTVLCQSLSIARYLAKEHGLMGKTILEEGQIDMIIESLNDLAVPVMTLIFESDEKKQAEMKKKYVENTLPETLNLLEKKLKENNEGNGFFVGDKVSVADLVLVSTSDWFPHVGVNDGLDKYPKLKALKARVEALPNIKKWLTNRPKTDL